MTKKQGQSFGAVQQRENSVRRGKGKPFEKGNPYAFKPGQSGNPAGRPKHARLSQALMAKLAETVPKAGEETIADLVAQALIKQALRGCVPAIREIADRTEGKPRQALDVDMRVTDWRELALQNGLKLEDVINEAKRIIGSIESEPAIFDGGPESEE